LLLTGSLIDPSYNSATAPESPSSSASLPDVDSSFAGPFDPDQLPLEIQNAMYDPRMFANNEIYIDPDIIGKLIIIIIFCRISCHILFSGRIWYRVYIFNINDRESYCTHVNISISVIIWFIFKAMLVPTKLLKGIGLNITQLRLSNMMSTFL
jgi:hypothetical protein